MPLTIIKIILLTVVVQIGCVSSRVSCSLDALYEKATALEVGVMMALFAFVPALFAIRSGQWIDSVGPKKPVLIGICIMSVAVFLPLGFDVKTFGLWPLYASCMVNGLGFMLVQMTNQQLVGHLSDAKNRTNNFAFLAMGYSAANLSAPIASGYLIDHLGWFVLGGILFMAGLASAIRDNPIQKAPGPKPADASAPDEHSVKSIVIRAAKVYLFVMALVFLGDGLKPLAMKTISHLSAGWLYWINTLSAVLDNATLAAIEVTPDISTRTLTFLLMSLIVSGGMLIPGNIPNIICASKLGIKSKEWAKAAVGLGAAVMVAYFIILTVVL